jgi:branched-chain amino acid transport system ATP-binding protein
MLEVENLRKNFGGLRAINGLGFILREHQFMGVIGPNGAGKTTLLSLITGYLSPTAGEIRFEGKRIDGLRPYTICRLGIGRTFQVVQPFGEMTVFDNVLTGALFSRKPLLAPDVARKQCENAIRLAGLEKRRNSLARTLTIGEKKRLELAKALATEPRLLLLDEVMAGLTRGEVDIMVGVLRNIHAAGMTILMIEHLVHVVLALTDEVLVLNFGSLLFRGQPREAVSDPRVIESYLGPPIDIPGAKDQAELVGPV